MKQLKKSFVLVLLVSSIFMTGCDANKVLDVISKISDGVQKAMPAATSIANSFSSLCSNSCQTSCSPAGSSSCTTPAPCADANISVLDPNREDASCSTSNTGTVSSCGSRN